MAVVRQGDQVVLLVVDVQVGVMQSAWDSARVIGNVARAVERARGQGVPVVWVQHGDDELRRGTPQWQWVPELVPREAEALVHKSFNSAFEATELETVLAGLGATHIVLAGAATNWCIRATAYGALDRGYDLTLVKDAHTTEDLTAWGAPPPEAVIAHTNLYWTNQTAPGRTAGTIETKDVDFEAAS